MASATVSSGACKAQGTAAVTPGPGSPGSLVVGMGSAAARA
jgi:hypothetical protein